MEKTAIPGPGACGGMYTANTMASAIEALGLSLANILGHIIPKNKITKILKSLNFEVTEAKTTWNVTVPTYRFLSLFLKSFYALLLQ